MKNFLPILTLAFLVSSLSANTGPGPWANGAYYPGQLDGRYTANVYNDAPTGGGVVRSNQFQVNQILSTNRVSGTNVNIDTGIITDTNLSPPAPAPFINAVTNTYSTNVVTSALATNVTSPAGANVVSGILGFAVRNGTPAVGSSTNAANAAVQGSTIGSAAIQTLSPDASMNYFLLYINGDTFAGNTAANINLETSKIAGSLINGGGRVEYLLFTNYSPAVGDGAPAPAGVQVISLPTANASGYFNANIKSKKSPFTFKGTGEVSVRSAEGDSVTSESVYPFKLDGIKASDNSISALSLSGRNAP